MTADIRVLPNEDALFRAAAEEFALIGAEASRAHGAFSVALSGGSTPRGLYRLLASDPGLKAAVPWDKTHVFWGDERHVPPDHSDSNYRMANETLLSKVPIPSKNVHRIAGEQPDAARAAAAYEEEIRRHFRLAPGELPRFDFVLLGLGTEAHTASLFPGTAALEETRRLAVSNWIDKLSTDRITLTAPVFNAAANVAFLVAGQDKAEPLKAVLEGPYEPRQLPAQLVRPASGRLLVFADAAAARLLEKAVS
jgi:6-phosphogluconolactonase